MKTFHLFKVVCFYWVIQHIFYQYSPGTMLGFEGIEVNKMDLVLLNIEFLVQREREKEIHHNKLW